MRSVRARKINSQSGKFAAVPGLQKQRGLFPSFPAPLEGLQEGVDGVVSSHVAGEVPSVLCPELLVLLLPHCATDVVQAEVTLAL